MVAKIAVKYAAKIDTKKSIEVLESFGTNEGLLYFLANVLPHTEDPDIYFKYIEACSRLGNSLGGRPDTTISSLEQATFTATPPGSGLKGRC